MSLMWTLPADAQASSAGKIERVILVRQFGTDAHRREEADMSEPRYPNESREYRDARESLLKDEQELVILRAVWRQEHAAALLIHVRSELGQSLPFLYVAGRWL